MNPHPIDAPMTSPRHAYAQHGHERFFRWRSREISRIEGFSDAVFAFAVTLLVISLEVPKTFSELQASLGGFVAFCMGFLLLFVVWQIQYKFFRRYGLEDGLTLWLNAILLFVVLFFVYPLKFLFTWLVLGLSGQSTQVRMPNGHLEAMVEGAQAMSLMAIYSSGYIAVFGVFLCMYWRAWTRRDALELNAIERWETRASMQELGLNVGIGALALFCAKVLNNASYAGFTYMLVGPAMTIHGVIMGRMRRQLE